MKLTIGVLIFSIAIILASAAPPSKTKGQCKGPNEEYKCAPPCVATCWNRQFAHCGFNCVEDCYCKDGYLRDEDDGTCKLPQDCFLDQKNGISKV